jgi:hypothetical protein
VEVFRIWSFWLLGLSNCEWEVDVDVDVELWFLSVFVYSYDTLCLRAEFCREKCQLTARRLLNNSRISPSCVQVSQGQVERRWWSYLVIVV